MAPWIQTPDCDPDGTGDAHGHRRAPRRHHPAPPRGTPAGTPSGCGHGGDGGSVIAAHCHPYAPRAPYRPGESRPPGARRCPPTHCRPDQGWRWSLIVDPGALTVTVTVTVTVTNALTVIGGGGDDGCPPQRRASLHACHWHGRFGCGGRAARCGPGCCRGHDQGCCVLCYFAPCYCAPCNHGPGGGEAGGFAGLPHPATRREGERGESHGYSLLPQRLCSILPQTHRHTHTPRNAPPSTVPRQ